LLSFAIRGVGLAPVALARKLFRSRAVPTIRFIAPTTSHAGGVRGDALFRVMHG
jgi:hypothetical protein